MKIKIEDIGVGGQCDCGRHDVGFLVRTCLTTPDGEDCIILTTFVCYECIAEMGIEIINTLK